MSTSTSDLTFDFINTTVNKSMKSKEDQLKSTIAGLGDNPSTQDLLMVQQEVTQWTLMSQIQSTLVKEIGDAMKGVIQKAG